MAAASYAEGKRIAFLPRSQLPRIMPKILRGVLNMIYKLNVNYKYMLK